MIRLYHTRIFNILKRNLIKILCYVKTIMNKGFSVSIFIMTLLPLEITNYTDILYIYIVYTI